MAKSETSLSPDTATVGRCYSGFQANRLSVHVTPSPPPRSDVLAGRVRDEFGRDPALPMLIGGSQAYPSAGFTGLAVVFHGWEMVRCQATVP